MKIERARNKLHRVAAGTSSDWETLSHDEQSTLQKIASSSFSIVTPGNLATVLGLYLVLAGLMNIVDGLLIIGLLQLLIGRLLDYFDGIVADVTKTKSSLGATLDETFDMIGLAASLYVLVTMDVVPLAAGIAVAVPKAGNVIGSVFAKYRKKRVNPTAQSKVGTAVIWASILLFITAYTYADLKQLPFDTAAWVLLVCGLLLTVPSTIEYLRLGFGDKLQED